MTTINLVMALCLLPILPIIYFVLRNYAKPKKNIILEVTLPHSAHNDTGVQEIVGGFKRWLNVATLLLLLLLIPPFMISSMGAVMTWYMTWFVFLILLPFVVFGIHREKLMVLKRRRAGSAKTQGRHLPTSESQRFPSGRSIAYGSLFRSSFH